MAEFFQRGNWLGFLRRYLLVSFFLHMVWEFVQMPLYTLWFEAGALKIALYGLHCTAGDAAIASAALMTALLIAGEGDWPGTAYFKVAILTILIGFAYTVYSEWLNVYIRKSWAYAPAMPLVPPFGIGLSPLLQWLVVPVLVLFYCRLCQQVKSPVDQSV